MGNYSAINIEDIFREYGIEFHVEPTKEELERIKLAFESAKDMQEFVREVREILKQQ